MLLGYSLWNVMSYLTFEILFKSGQGLLVYFLYNKCILQK